MQYVMPRIPMREALHFLGWRGSPIDDRMLEQIQKKIDRVEAEIQPRIVMRCFSIAEDGAMEGAAFLPHGQDVKRLLASCHQAVLLAATLGAQSERMLLKEQAIGSSEAVLLDAVLSAAIEAFCDQEEASLRGKLEAQGLYLTDRFSPGYGDMPIEQTRSICNVLSADRSIGLTVSQSGIMIPRKSVTAVMGISRTPIRRRASGCEICTMRDTCALRNKTYTI